MPFVKGSQHTAEARARMSRSGKRRAVRDRERLKLTPKALRRYLAFRECAPGLKPIVRASEEEMLDLVADLTGGGTIEDLPAGKRLLLESAMQTVVASRALFAMFIETRDCELASRMATQATTLHRALVTLGLERVARELDLTTYLEQKAAQDRADAPNAAAPDPSIESTSKVANRDGEGAALSHPQGGAPHHDSPAGAEGRASVGHEGGARRESPPAPPGVALISAADVEGDPC
jgi:hypothetical protein